MSEEKSVKEARVTYDGLMAERRANAKQLGEAKAKLEAKLGGERMPESLKDLRAEADRLEERRLKLPDLIIDARDELLTALEEEKKNLEPLLGGAKQAALDELEAAFEDFSKAKDTLEKKIMGNKNIKIFLEQFPNPTDQIIFDNLITRAFKNWGEPAGTPISAKVRRQLEERMGEVAGLLLVHKEMEIESLSNEK